MQQQRIDSALKTELTFSQVVSQALGRSYTPERLIGALKNNLRLAHLFEQDSGVMENYTIEKHTLFVLHQFERYFCDHAIPGLSIDSMRIMLALHDIGKPLRSAAESQHQCTLRIIDELQAELPLSNREFRIVRALISQDIFGTLIRSSIVNSATIDDRKGIHELDAQGVVDSATLNKFTELTKVGEVGRDQSTQNRMIDIAKWFIQNGEELQILPTELFTLVLMYYQCDTMAYTSDAVLPSGEHAKIGLEFLYQLTWKDGARRPNRLFSLQNSKPQNDIQSAFSAGAETWVNSVKSTLLFMEAAIPSGAIVSKDIRYAEKVRTFRDRVEKIDLPTRITQLVHEKNEETQSLYLKSIIFSRWDPKCTADQATRLVCMESLHEICTSPLYSGYIKVLAFRALIAISPDGTEAQYFKKCKGLRNEMGVSWGPGELFLRHFDNPQALSDWVKVYAPNRFCYTPPGKTDEGYDYGDYVYLQGRVLRDLVEFLRNIDSAKSEAENWGCQLPFNEKNFPRIKNSCLSDILHLAELGNERSDLFMFSK